MQKDYLNSKNITFSEILVDENPDEAQKMIAISLQKKTVNKLTFLVLISKK